MQYEGNIIRPPSEADSIILQVAVGCPHNTCTFCGAYKEQPFRIKGRDELLADLDFAARYCRRQRRVFLADGDVLLLSMNRLEPILRSIQTALPWVNRISLYGSGRAIRNKTIEELKRLKELGLARIYMGLESGSETVLCRVKKGDSAAGMIAAGKKVREAGLFLSVTALLGLGGRDLSHEHALETAKSLSFMQPSQIALLTLMVLENTELADGVRDGDFHLLSPREILEELRLIVDNLGNTRCQFHANHASSYLPLAGRLPKDRDALLKQIDMALAGERSLRPDHLRAL